MSPLKSTDWNKLDNAAKIFPPTSNERDTKVFRFSCQLKEEVDEQLLQQALDDVIGKFPVFCSVLKRGIFWYYLEHRETRPLVFPEHKPPCSELYDRNRKNLLFEVTYFRKRINLEIYHALSDGTGALEFLRTLTCRYLSLAHPEIEGDPVSELDYDASVFEKGEDSFLKYYDPKKKVKRQKVVRAYQLKSPLLAENRQRVIEGTMPVKEVIQVAKSYGATLTEYLSTLMLVSIAKQMPVTARKKPVSLDIPINLRNYYESATARNFFGVMQVSYQFGREDELLLELVLDHVKRTFERELSKDKIEERMVQLSAIEHNLVARAVPLPIKDLVLGIASKYTRISTTASLSNVGKISMPPSVQPYIERFDLMTGTDKIQACVCSYLDQLTITFMSGFVSTEVQKNFFRMLTAQGIPVCIETSPMPEIEEE